MVKGLVGGLKGPFRGGGAGGYGEGEKMDTTQYAKYIFFQSNSSNLIGRIDRRDTINFFQHSLYGPHMPYHIIIINIHFWQKNST